MSTDPGEGRFFGEYLLLEVAGTGGMGVVYRAEQRSLERIVALKVIRPEIAQSGDYRSRFLREARLAALVDHPHVVPVFDVGEYEGRLYLAMQWIDGLDLRTILDRQQRLSPERSVRIATQVAWALQAVHDAGLVHRDVKPANVLVRDVDGLDHAYLTDFGIAKIPGAEGDLTRTGWVVGTPGYLSPEQLQGHKPGSRSDLYALGCILFEALTGHHPFQGPGGEDVRWAGADSPGPAASAVLPALGHQYDAFLARALAFHPEDRFACGHDFAEALRVAHEQRRGTRAHLPTARVTLGHGPAAQPLTASRAAPAPAASPTHESEPTVRRPVPPRPIPPVPREAGAHPGARPRAAPSGAPPGTGRRAARAPRKPRKRWAAKLIVLACCGAFAASLTLLTSYYRVSDGWLSLLQATSGAPEPPLYPRDFWILLGLAALVVVLTVISLPIAGRFLMACAAAAALGLVGYTLYIPTLGSSPGFGPYGSSYWVSLGAAAAMALVAGAAAVIPPRRAGRP